MSTMNDMKKNLGMPDEVRTFPKGKIELVTLQDITVGRATFEPGWQWSTCVKPIAGTDSCQAGHMSYVLSGKMRVVMDDGTEVDYGPGDAMLVAPGHDAWTLGNEPCIVIDFSGMKNYAVTGQ